MNPSRASERSDLRQQFGADEAVAAYVSKMKSASRVDYQWNYLYSHHGRPLTADDAREIGDESMSGSLTELLYKSREDPLK